MDFIGKDVLSGEIVPVLLGFSPEMGETARRMYREYNVVSHVFCHRSPLPLRLSLFMKFHTIRHTTGERLMVKALLDFAGQIGHNDVILYLIPCSMEYANMILQYREILERYYVIAGRDEMSRVWFGEPLTNRSSGKEETQT